MQNIDVKEKLKKSAYPYCSGVDDKAHHQLQDERNTSVGPTQNEVAKVNDFSPDTKLPLQEQENYDAKSVSKGEAGVRKSSQCSSFRAWLNHIPIYYILGAGS